MSQSGPTVPLELNSDLNRKRGAVQIQTGPSLAIELDGGASVFTPGQIITGKVVRKAALSSPLVSVTIGIVGRTRAYHTNRPTETFDLFGATLSQTLYTGLLHLPSSATSGGQCAWEPFSILIPSNAVFSAVAADKRNEHSFLPLTESAVSPSPIPFSFYSRHSPVLVEYFLVANLHAEKSRGVLKSRAIHPITISPPLVEPLVITSLQTHTIDQPLPKFKHSRHDRRRHPELRGITYRLQAGIKLPSEIQLDSETPIPLKVFTEVSPIESNTPETWRQIEMKFLSLHLIAHATVPRDGQTIHHQRRWAVAYHEWRWDHPHRWPVPASNCDAANLGQALDIRFAGDGLRFSPGGAHGWPGEGAGMGIRGDPDGCFPDFETYNLRLRHSLRWKVKLTMGGRKMVTLVGEVEVKILGKPDPGPTGWVGQPVVRSISRDSGRAADGL